MKILMAYYSRRGNNFASSGIVDLAVGNTEIVAKAIQKLIGGDVFRIDPVKESSGAPSLRARMVARSSGRGSGVRLS